MIKCSLMGMKKYSFTLCDSEKIKYGRYLSSFFNTSGYGKKYWAVGVNIGVDYEKYEKEGLTLDEVIKGCVEFLNAPPKSKYKRGRKRKIPKYGFFCAEPYRYYLKEKNNKKYIQAILMVEDRKRKHFWGQGRKDVLKRNRR